MIQLPRQASPAWLERLGNVANRKIAILGITFQLGPDGRWASVSADLGHILTLSRANVWFYDPVTTHFVGRDGRPVDVLGDAYSVLRAADAAIIAAGWPQITQLNWRLVRGLMRQPYIYDATNILNPISLLRQGFIYENVLI